MSPKCFAYRMSSDTGKAPRVFNGFCVLTGCKSRKKNGTENIEERADKGDWIIGIGGNNTGQPDRVIYMLKVFRNYTFEDFQQQYKEEASYFRIMGHGSNVLFAKKFFYFGTKAIALPGKLKDIILGGPNYKNIPIDKLEQLLNYVNIKGFREYRGYGVPNNESKIKAVIYFKPLENQ